MERRFQLLAGAVQVLLANGRAPADIVSVLSDAARFARERRRHGLIIISGVDDPATAEAVSMALEEIDALGAPAFRIAFVACTLPQYSVYHFAERYARRFGIVSKVLVSLRDAKEWLGQRDNAHAWHSDDNDDKPIRPLLDRAARRMPVEVTE
jgi:hypothetical protein